MAAHKFRDPKLAKLVKSTRSKAKKKTKRKKASKRRKVSKRRAPAHFPRSLARDLGYSVRRKPAKKRKPAKRKPAKRVYKDKNGRIISAAQHRARVNFAKAAKARARASKGKKRKAKR